MVVVCGGDVVVVSGGDAVVCGADVEVVCGGDGVVVCGAEVAVVVCGAEVAVVVCGAEVVVAATVVEVGDWPAGPVVTGDAAGGVVVEVRHGRVNHVATPIVPTAPKLVRNRRRDIMAESYGFSIAPMVGAVVERRAPTKSAITPLRTSAVASAGLPTAGV